MNVRAIDFERRAAAAWQRVRRSSPAVLWRATRLGLLALLHACLGALQQVAEIAAPFLLIAGAGWWLLPRALGLIVTRDPSAADVMNQVVGQLPTTLVLAGYTLSPGGLVVAGALAVAVAAASQTLMTLIGARFYRRG